VLAICAHEKLREIPRHLAS
jgi:hypothetical protein